MGDSATGIARASCSYCLLVSWPPAPNNVRECFSCNIDIGSVDESAVANIVLVAGPKLAILVVRSNDDVTISRESKIATVVRFIRPRSEGPLERIVQAQILRAIVWIFFIFAKSRDYSGRCVGRRLHAKAEGVIMQLRTRRGTAVSKTIVHSNKLNSLP